MMVVTSIHTENTTDQVDQGDALDGYGHLIFGVA